MAVCYQYDAQGFYVGRVDDLGGPMPHGCTRVKPVETSGHWPKWDGQSWGQAENHLGEKGYIEGRPVIIRQYGPYPEGWSQAPPEPSREDKIAALKLEIMALEQKGERPNREINLALARLRTPPQESLGRLETLEVEIGLLRARLQVLIAEGSD